MNESQTADKTVKKVQVGVPFKSGKDWNGNALGRPVGAISLVTDIKQRLIHIKEHQPEKYQSIIDDYWMDKGKRELLIKIVEPNAFAPQVAIQNNISVQPILGGRSITKCPKCGEEI